MKIVVVTTPRTGSSLITSLLFNLAHQWWGSKNNLREFFTINPLYKEEFGVVAGIITRLSYVRQQQHDFSLDLEEKNRRLQLLVNDPNYTFKIFSSDITPEIEHFIRDNYQVVYLERRDKIAQLLSFLNLFNTNISHYKKDSQSISQIQYNKQHAKLFLSILQRYFDVKGRMPGKILYYEDFLDAGSDEQALIKLLEFPLSDFNALKWDFVKTPYSDQPDRLIVNHSEWLQHLPLIKTQIEKIQGHELL